MSRRILIIIFILSAFIIMPQRICAYQDESAGEYFQVYSQEEGYNQEAWLEFEESNPFLYHALNFLNPPLLNNILGNIFSLMIAVGCLGAIYAFEGKARIIMILICGYFWCRLISVFVIIILVGQGVLSP